MDKGRLMLVLGFLVVVILASYLIYSRMEVGGDASIDLSTSVSPSTVTPGGSFTLSGSVSNYSWSSPGWYCVDFSDLVSGSWCNTAYSGQDQCYRPCAYGNLEGDPSIGYQVYKCVDASGQYGCRLARYSGDWPTIYAEDDPNYGGGVDYLLAISSTPSSYKGFLIPPGHGVRFNFEIRNVSSVSVPAIVFLCYDASLSSSVYVGYSTEYGWTRDYGTDMGGQWYGTTWTCYAITKTIPANSTADGYWDVEAPPTSSGARVYISFTDKCSYYKGSYCASTTMYYRVAVTSVMPSDGLVGVKVVPGFGSPFTCGPSVFEAESLPYSFSSSCVVDSGATAGSYSLSTYVCDEGLYLYHSTSSYSTALQYASDYCIGYSFASDTDYVTVVTPATDVSLSGVRQEPDDSTVEGTITVSGGTAFDYVKVYIDGSVVATVYKSSFSCGTTSCTYSFNYSMYGKSDGSHTVKAELYVDGSLKDSATASFSYYQIGIRNVSASRSYATFEDKGGYKYVQVYVDSTSCVAKSWTYVAPSSAHNWAGDGVMYDWPSCAASEGAHTVYVQLKDESGHIVTDSAVVTVSYSYSLSNPQPPQGTRYYVQSPSKWTVPSDFQISTSVSYSTDSPSATLVEYFAGSQVASESVSGSGTFTYTITGSQIGSGCGTGKVISWSLGDATAQTTVDIYCVYADIVRPTGTVTLPTSDGSVVLQGSSVVVEVEAVSNPVGVSLTPNVTIDGVSGVPVACSDPSNYCYRFDASGWTCGSTHTVNLSVDADGNPSVATDSATFTVNCALNYVDVVSPSDGSTVNIYEPIQDVQMTLAVDWASDDPGAYLKVWVNGAYRDLATVTDCSSTVCYALKYSDGLQLGANDVRVELYDSSGNLVADDNVSFHVNYWSFVFGEDWSSTPAVVYVKDNGEPDHADYCEYDINGETGVLNFNPSLIRWELPITEDDVGKTVSVVCYYGSDVVFDGNYTVQGNTVEQPATPVNITIGGGGSTYTVSAFPVFPEYDRSGQYIYSVYVYKGSSASSVFKDVYVSNGQLCFVPRTGSHKIYYYKADFRAFPTSENDVDQIIGSLRDADLVEVPVTQQGSAYCFPIKGTAMVLDSVDDGDVGEYYFVILDTQQSTFDMNVVFVGVIVALLLGYVLYQRGVLSLG